jgi:hypothetical protein
MVEEKLLIDPRGVRSLQEEIEARILWECPICPNLAKPSPADFMLVTCPPPAQAETQEWKWHL